MSLKASLPGYRDPIVGQGGLASRPVYTFFQAIATTVDSLSDQIGNVTTTPAESPVSENANVVGKYSIYTRGILKTGIVSVLLIGDVETPGNTQYYGSNATGEKGWYAVADALDSTANITLTVGTDGVTTFDLADLANSGTGAALVKLTRDSKGRISGTSAATTDDLTEGSANLWFTNERAQDAVGAALVGTGNVPLSYNDTGNAISAALSAGVLASLSKADSAVQSIVAGTGVSVDTTDPQNPVVSAPGAGSVDTSFKNRLINGDFGINQRVFAGGALAASVYGYDRWKAGTGGCNVTVNAATGVLTHTSGPHVQVLEAPNLAGKTVTVSVEDPSGSITVNIDGVSGTITSGSGRRGVSLAVPSGSTGNVTLTMTATGVTYKRVQLEVGTAATEWDQRHPAVELAMSQRYYQKTYKLSVKPGSASTNGEIPLVFMASTASAASSTPLAVRMRSAPAVSYYDRAGNASKVSVDAANSVSIVTGGIYATDNLMTADFDAVTGLRARFHVVLDAEL